ncbi:MAG: transposase [Rhodoferax sp.]
MARLPRLTLAGHAHHLIVRGNNRQAIVLDHEDRQRWLTVLGQAIALHGVALHAYVLMDNHFHLLATPERDDSVPLAMQALGRAYVRGFNQRHRRTGTLWEGRYKSTLIQTERHLLACMAYIDLNPVRAGMVAQARDYPWSSHGHYIGLRTDPLITPHALVWELGNTPFEREAAYAQRVQAGLDARQTRALTESTLKGWALGDAEFVAQLQTQTHRRVSPGSAGRPRRHGTQS